MIIFFVLILVFSLIFSKISNCIYSAETFLLLIDAITVFLLKELNMNKRDLSFPFLNKEFGIDNSSSIFNKSTNLFKIRPIKCFKLLKGVKEEGSLVGCNGVFTKKRTSGSLLKGRDINKMWNLKSIKSHKQFEYKIMFTSND